MPTIIYIEPDKLLAEAYTSAFEKAGFTVFHSFTGQEAMDKADEVSTDLIIMELQLPAHDGMEFLYEFRSYSDWQNIPVILITNLPFQNMKEAEQILKSNLGVHEVFYKPKATIQLVLRSVSEVISNPKNAGKYEPAGK